MSTSPEIIAQIRELAAQGIDLNGIQKALAESGTPIRFMDLRFLLLDHGIEIATAQAAPAAAAPQEESSSNIANNVPVSSPAPALGAVDVFLDEIQIPGTMLSGKAIFPSGIRGAWVFDQRGQFAWSDLSADPTPAELQQFQQALSKILSQEN